MEARESSHQKALVQCREEMIRLVGVGDVSTVPVNEELIRKKYSKETKQIKVFNTRRNIWFHVHFLSQTFSAFLCLILVLPFLLLHREHGTDYRRS